MTFTEDVKCLVHDFISLQVSPTRFFQSRWSVFSDLILWCKISFPCSTKTLGGEIVKASDLAVKFSNFEVFRVRMQHKKVKCSVIDLRWISCRVNFTSVTHVYFWLALRAWVIYRRLSERLAFNVKAESCSIS